MLQEIRYTLRLRRPVVLSTYCDDPNLVESQEIIPGSTILGAAARAYINISGQTIPNGEAHKDVNFAKWFLNGGLYFLNAYPYLNEVRLLPAPLSIHTSKDNPKELYDLSNPIQLDEVHNPVNAIKLANISGFISINDGVLTQYSPAREMRFHNSRPNRLKGHASENEGGVFAYESLNAGQIFAGRILGERDELLKFLELTHWAHEHTILWIGRSSTAEYGGQAELQLLNQEPEVFTGEIYDRQAKNFEPDKIVITLLSPLISRDMGGRPAAILPLEELRLILKDCGLVPTRVLHTYARTVVVGGYLSIWNLPRPQSTAFAPGSVFVIEIVRNRSSDCLFNQIEQYSLGIRQNEGFGRFTIDWHSAYELRLPINQEPVTKPSMELPAMLKKIYRSSYNRLILNQASEVGIIDGNSVGVVSCISSAQLGRLKYVLNHENGIDQLNDLLGKLRQNSKSQLENVIINSKSLLSILKEPSIHSRLTQNVSQINDIELLAQLKLTEIERNILEIKANRIYLLNLCTQLARRKRLER